MEKERRQYSAGLKLKCIAERKAGKTYAQIAAAHNVHRTSVSNWCRAGKDKILKSGYDGAEDEIVIITEDAMPRKVTPEDLKKELKAAKEELSYYRHAAAYYKALNQVLLEDAGEDKKASKKKDSKR